MWTAADRPTVAVLLPGSGSDAEFIHAAFADALAALGIRLVAVAPQPGTGVVEQLLADLDLAAGQHHRPLVGGVSLGAHVAASWAIGNRHRCAGLLVAMPGWIGEPGTAAAAVTAIAAADAVQRYGVEDTLTRARAGAPGWLGGELDRSWRRYGQALPASLRAAAATRAPDVDELSRLRLPAGVAGAVDDPVHPLAVAQAWAAALPAAALVTTTLAAIGRDRAALGRAAVLAWLCAQHRT